MRASRTVRALGLRIGDAVPIEEAPARLSRQAAASAVWVELDGEVTDGTSGTLSALNRDAADGRYAAIVSATPPLVDDLFGVLDDQVHLLIDADDAERASALSLAIALHSERHFAADVASDRSAERLRQLSDEVGRIAATLARLSTGPSPALTAPPVQQSGESGEVPIEVIRKVIRARRLRSRFFRDDLFADPAWDMLLDLLHAEIQHLRVPVSSLCIAASVPATTALRWLKTMVREGLFLRRADPHDGRRVFVELAPQTSDALRRYFAEVGAAAVI
ncbi:MarR family transcriptional regulator [Sphingomonas sp.]|uniref:MarR family transcriptional regulator n=1 Tax=Sphingomonas sp. TaxID=28214 RepID=UPI0025FC2CBD|nr:MarR family transcriptional regulator [Sphingomonas sp.]